MVPSEQALLTNQMGVMNMDEAPPTGGDSLHKRHNHRSPATNSSSNGASSTGASLPWREDRELYWLALSHVFARSLQIHEPAEKREK